MTGGNLSLLNPGQTFNNVFLQSGGLTNFGSVNSTAVDTQTGAYTQTAGTVNVNGNVTFSGSFSTSGTFTEASNVRPGFLPTVRFTNVATPPVFGNSVTFSANTIFTGIPSFGSGSTITTTGAGMHHLYRGRGELDPHQRYLHPDGRLLRHHGRVETAYLRSWWHAEFQRVGCRDRRFRHHRRHF